MAGGRQIVSLLAERQNLDQFRKKNWQGTFEDYLDLVAQNPAITRNAFQRCYDMILSYGVDTYEVSREKKIHYRFFDDPLDDGKDAIFGLEDSQVQLVNALKSAAHGYGIEKRVLLLHGPVGSSKSTMARLLKKGIERYSAKDEGALYSLGWVDPANPDDPSAIQWCPMNEDPLHLIPEDFRSDVVAQFQEASALADYPIRISGELCPFCRFHYMESLTRHGGDWTKVIGDVRVRRVILSEKDRIGIGTFQPKDEKNQDSTELTGDIYYRKIAEYGTDSDPRAFNFDGEFNVANRGNIEFVEVL